MQRAEKIAGEERLITMACNCRQFNNLHEPEVIPTHSKKKNKKTPATWILAPTTQLFLCEAVLSLMTSLAQVGGLRALPLGAGPIRRWLPLVPVWVILAHLLSDPPTKLDNPDCLFVAFMLKLNECLKFDRLDEVSPRFTSSAYVSVRENKQLPPINERPSV